MNTRGKEVLEKRTGNREQIKRYLGGSGSGGGTAEDVEASVHPGEEKKNLIVLKPDCPLKVKANYY